MERFLHKLMALLARHREWATSFQHPVAPVIQLQVPTSQAVLLTAKSYRQVVLVASLLQIEFRTVALRTPPLLSILWARVIRRSRVSKSWWPRVCSRGNEAHPTPSLCKRPKRKSFAFLGSSMGRNAYSNRITPLIREFCHSKRRGAVLRCLFIRISPWFRRLLKKKHRNSKRLSEVSLNSLKRYSMLPTLLMITTLIFWIGAKVTF